MNKGMTLLFTLFYLLCLAACDPRPKEGGDSPGRDILFTVTTDYSTGSFSTVGLYSLRAYNDLGPAKIHSDASARYFNGLIYVVNRLGRDNVQVLDPQKDFETVLEISAGTASDPHDIAVLPGGKAYVTRYNMGSLLILDTLRGAAVGEIDLSSFADDNSPGVPRMDRLYYDGGTGYLFVSLQRLESRWVPSDHSSIVVIDTGDDSIVKEIVLSWEEGGTVTAKNPSSKMRLVPASYWQPEAPDGNDHLFVSCTGEFGHFYREDGGIVAVDLKDLECEKGFVFSEESASSEITDFVIGREGRGYAVTSDEEFCSSLIVFSRGRVESVLYRDDGKSGNLWSMEIHSATGRLFVCDRNVENPGVRIYSTFDDDISLNGGQPVDTGLPPFDLAVVE